MMPTNWPPASAPSWPPPEFGERCEASDLRTLVRALQESGYTLSPPTPSERNAFFRDARCDDGHPVLGRMVVSPGGTRYPFAVCQDPAHRALLTLWEPYEAGWQSEAEE